MILESVEFGEAELAGCDCEPAPSPGAIQSHGVMLVIDRRDFAIRHFAGDTQFLLGVEPSRMLELNLSDLFDDRVLPPILRRLAVPAARVAPSVMLGLRARDGSLPLDAAFHANGDLAIIELEPSQVGGLARGDALAQVKNMLAALPLDSDFAAYCQTAAAEVRALAGFDRVMVYQFLADGSGKVLAEDKAEGTAALLGLHYPASDIPHRARALYKRNRLRLIPNAHYAPAPLQPAIDIGLALDMTDCALRGVSPGHLEYLRNLGVAASMSVSILVGDELWGFITCHHHAPRTLSADLRIACELFTQLFSLQLEAKLEVVAGRRRAVTRRVQQGLIARVAQTDGLTAALIGGDPCLRDLIPADGVALWMNGALHTAGDVPPIEFIAGLASWLKGLDQPVLSSFELGALYPAAAHHAGLASGILALSISRQNSDYVFWFRGETVRRVSWAKAPAKPEEKRGQSLPWEAVEIEAAQDLRVWLLETVLRQLDLVKKEREATVAHQAMLVAELDHRVKNALANVQALVQLTKIGARSVDDFALALQSRIRAMAHAHILMSESHWQGAKLQKLIEGELAPYRGGKDLTLAGEDVTLTAQAAAPLTQVIHELISNAAKYGALSAPGGKLAIEWRRDANGALALTWTERNGPPVSPPTRTGFGSVVIKRTLAHELDGSARLSFEPDGVVCVLTLPAHCLVARGH